MINEFYKFQSEINQVTIHHFTVIFFHNIISAETNIRKSNSKTQKKAGELFHLRLGAFGFKIKSQVYEEFRRLKESLNGPV